MRTVFTGAPALPGPTCWTGLGEKRQVLEVFRVRAGGGESRPMSRNHELLLYPSPRGEKEPEFPPEGAGDGLRDGQGATRRDSEASALAITAKAGTRRRT